MKKYFVLIILLFICVTPFAYSFSNDLDASVGLPVDGSYTDVGDEIKTINSQGITLFIDVQNPNAATNVKFKILGKFAAAGTGEYDLPIAFDLGVASDLTLGTTDNIITLNDDITQSPIIYVTTNYSTPYVQIQAANDAHASNEATISSLVVVHNKMR